MGQPFGKYQLLRKIGTGGMGEVFLAQALETGLQVVVKRVLPHLVENEEFLSLFLDEARTAARLNHPNISQIYELGDVDGSWYLAMEYVAGRDLRQLAQAAKAQKRPVPLGVACRVISQAAAGLSYAHTAKGVLGKPLGLVHRDVSPHNILVGFDGSVKLIDFGVAKAAGRSADTGMLQGKYPYMSPEQVKGEPLDARSDQFSLGVVFWELLTGKRLFKGESDPVTLRLIWECKVKPPALARPSVPPELSALAMRTLARDPQDRFPGMAELRDALDEFVAVSGQRAEPWQVAQYLQALFPEGDGSQSDRTDPGQTRSAGSTSGRSRSASVRSASAASFENAATSPTGTRSARPSLPQAKLPPPPARWVGREGELDALQTLLEAGARLVSVCGPAGIGKTQLALRTARSMAGGLEGGLFYCDLSLARDPEEARLALAAALEADPEQPAGGLGERGEVVGVLDGLSPWLSSTVQEWQAQAAGARLLITSTTPLGMPGEQSVEVPALSLELARELFLAVAAAGRVQSPSDLEGAKALGPWLGGLPLAIEWAALRWAQGGALPPPGGGSSLEATLAWVDGQLSGWQRLALAQASVFRGGFSLEAAEAVLDLSAEPDAPWALDALQSLKEAGLVRTYEAALRSRSAEAPTEVRFELQRDVRRFAQARLGQLKFSEQTEARHSAYYLREAAGWAEAAEGPSSGAALDRLSLERENLLVCCKRALERGPGDRPAAQAALQALLALEPLHLARGPRGLHRSLLEGSLAQAPPGLEPRLHASALRARAQARQAHGALDEAVEDLQAAQVLAQTVRDRKLQGRLEGVLATTLRHAGHREQAQASFSRALPLHRDSGDRKYEALALTGLAGLEHERGRPGEAHGSYLRALAIFREQGDRRFVALLLGYSGAALADLGKLEEAEGAISEAEGLMRGLHDSPLGAALSLCRGHLELALANSEKAQGHTLAAEATRGALDERLARVSPLARVCWEVQAAARCLQSAMAASLS